MSENYKNIKLLTNNKNKYFKNVLTNEGEYGNV